MVNSLLTILQCSACGGQISRNEKGCSCERCHRTYLKKGETFFFYRDEGNEASRKADGIIFWLKSLVKKNPRVFTLLNHTLGIYVGTSARRSIAHLPKGATILNIGSGSEIIRDDVINLDSMPHPGVSLVADAHALPLKTDSIDAVIAESVLEHVKGPERVVGEIYRVLKPGGMVYFVLPLIIGFHSSPDDYYRWTTSGTRELLKRFEEKELGIAAGPTNAMTYVLREWLALVLSFNSRTVHQILVLFFMVLFAPLNLLDYILRRYALADNIAHLYYYIGVKK